MAYNAQIGRMLFISLVARVMRPGCKCDYVIVLEGLQGARKSSACRIIGGKWFSDALPDISGDPVRSSMHLRGKWLIEIPELSAIHKSDVERLKSFITMNEETYLPKYGRTEVNEPRQCVFIATTNKTTYIQDETGGRRFWPVRVGQSIDLDALAHDRDQLFAEAMVAFRAGEKWWPDREFENEFIRPEQEARVNIDEWENIISVWAEEESVTKATITEIGLKALGIEKSKLSKPEQNRIKDALTRLGWEFRRTGLARWWERKR